MKHNICTVCGRIYIPHAGQRKYCSYYCAEKAAKKRAEELKYKDYMTGKCPTCKKTFKKKRGNQVFCSKECKTVASKLRAYRRYDEKKRSERLC